MTENTTLVWTKRGTPVEHLAAGGRIKLQKKMFRNWYLVCVTDEPYAPSGTGKWKVVGRVSKLADAKSFAERYCVENNIPLMG